MIEGTCGWLGKIEMLTETRYMGADCDCVDMALGLE